eukprot:GHVT01001939.1.p1 GENE.GHVT01001939.1~~GHVT01001939.1.p1  ORF type:complete len:148 (+),score=16.49 GHVT01001939.1:279-722(+)
MSGRCCSSSCCRPALARTRLLSHDSKQQIDDAHAKGRRDFDYSKSKCQSRGVADAARNKPNTNDNTGHSNSRSCSSNSSSCSSSSTSSSSKGSNSLREALPNPQAPFSFRTTREQEYITPSHVLLRLVLYSIVLYSNKYSNNTGVAQ